MNRHIRKLYIEPTACCNLNCNMCFRHSWIDEPLGSMDAQLVTHVMQIPNLLPDLEQVMFAGMGEPLIHPKIMPMIRSFAENGISTKLLTNGTRLNRKCAEELIDSGLSMLWVSVDGFDRASYEQVHIGSRFDLITDNLNYFNQIRKACKLGITFVIMKDNVKQLKLINEFADRYNVDNINLSFAVPSEPLKMEDACYNMPYSIGIQHRVESGAKAAPQHNHCPFIEEDSCFIKWDGNVMPCMQLLHSSYTYFFEERRKVLSKSFGNIRNKPLRSIWEDTAYVDFRKRVHEFAFSDCTDCLGCDDRLENQTDCMYNIFPTCGACLWAQGIGRCP